MGFIRRELRLLGLTIFGDGNSACWVDRNRDGVHAFGEVFLPKRKRRRRTLEEGHKRRGGGTAPPPWQACTMRMPAGRKQH